jgi:hypothetical protein
MRVPVGTGGRIQRAVRVAMGLGLAAAAGLGLGRPGAQIVVGIVIIR